MFFIKSPINTIEVQGIFLYHLFVKNSKLAFLCLSGLAFVSLASCQDANSIDAVRMPYGKLYDSGSTLAENIKSITWSALSGMVSDKATFVLLVDIDPDSYCTCFSYLKNDLVSYLASSNAYLYTITPSEFDGSGKSTFDLKVSGTEGNETIAIFENGGIKYQRQRAGQDDAWTRDADAFSEWMKARVNVPDMLYVSTKQLASLSQDVPYVRSFFWTSCPDCQYVSDNFLKTYNLQNHTRWYAFDCDVEGVRILNGVTANRAAEEGTPAALAYKQYQAFMKTYGISSEGSAEFGYDRGFVPCFQFISNGEVADMDVYVNDTLSANDDGTYKIAQSYWDGTREHDFFNYLGSAVVKDFTQEAALQAIPASDTENGCWAHPAAAKYHDPLLKGFLDHYLGK